MPGARPAGGFAIDYQMIVDVRAFEVNVEAGNSADIELFLRVLNDRNGQVRAALPSPTLRQAHEGEGKVTARYWRSR
jgi:ABC-type uncharacterized transport system auxiliary subunit